MRQRARGAERPPPTKGMTMSLRVSRVTKALCGSVAPLLAGICFVACSAETGEPTSTASEAVTGNGAMHSHLTRGSFQREAGREHGRPDGHPRRLSPPLAVFPLCD